LLAANIDEYSRIVGRPVIDELYMLASRLQGKVVQNINSTAVGGGVAEILVRMIPLLKQIGVDARWDVIKGNERFFTITKNIHNALHGKNIELSAEEVALFLDVNRLNAAELSFAGDIIFIHDPQPIALVDKKAEVGKKWIWRCHIDLVEANPAVMSFVRSYAERYDSAVFSSPTFSREDLSIPQALIAPSIDPLSDKNRDLTQGEITSVLAKFNIDPGKPIVTQISRFDYFKDPVGVIKVFRMVRKYIDCQLILAGGGATDDPEGLQVLQEVQAEAANDPDIHVLLLPPSSDVEINALVRASEVVLQKSLREGFGLTVSEALWKARPVIASGVGGIPLQIRHQYSGILTYSLEGTAYYLKQLLHEPEYARKLGQNGREHVKNNFLITRHIRDYLMLFLSVFYEGDVIRL
jgi:trehalose synthase